MSSKYLLIGDRAGVRVVENFRSEDEVIAWLAENEHGWDENPLVYAIDEYLGVMQIAGKKKCLGYLLIGTLVGSVKVIENFESENEVIDWLAENEHGWQESPRTYIIDEYLGIMLPVEIDTGIVRRSKSR